MWQTRNFWFINSWSYSSEILKLTDYEIEQVDISPQEGGTWWVSRWKVLLKKKCSSPDSDEFRFAENQNSEEISIGTSNLSSAELREQLKAS